MEIIDLFWLLYLNLSTNISICKTIWESECLEELMKTIMICLLSPYFLKHFKIAYETSHRNKTHTRGYSPEPNSIWQVFPFLIGFGFSPISKHGYGTCNGYIGTHPELIPKHIPNVGNYFMLIWHVILFDNCRVIKTTIDI